MYDPTDRPVRCKIWITYEAGVDFFFLMYFVGAYKMQGVNPWLMCCLLLFQFKIKSTRSLQRFSDVNKHVFRLDDVVVVNNKNQKTSNRIGSDRNLEFRDRNVCPVRTPLVLWGRWRWLEGFGHRERQRGLWDWRLYLSLAVGEIRSSSGTNLARVGSPFSLKVQRIPNVTESRGRVQRLQLHSRIYKVSRWDEIPMCQLPNGFSSNPILFWCQRICRHQS